MCRVRSLGIWTFGLRDRLRERYIRGLGFTVESQCFELFCDLGLVEEYKVQVRDF